MHISKAARRYATALLELGKERDEVKPILKDMAFINATLDGSSELVLFLQSPIVKFDDKKAVLNALFSDEVTEVTRKFLELLVRKNRSNMLHQVSESFLKLYNKYAGIIEVEVMVAHELDDSQKEKLHKQLEKKTGKKVDLTIQIDASLKGGMAVRIEDTVIDGTVKHKLRELEEQLLATAQQ